ncbi:MAG: hypothetical protein Q9159_005604 [Coniocarpon cinnabarinum]
MLVGIVKQLDGQSPDEIALYDRQIRLWGMEAQNAIRNARILLITVKALGNEIAKNLVLAGIDSLTISDLSPVEAEDLGAQFFLTEEDIGKNIQKLNPRVKCSILPGDPFTSQETSYVQGFDIVIATDLPVVKLNIVNDATRINQTRFYCAGSHGVYGYMFADLIQHTFSYERDPSNSLLKPGDAETPTRVIVDVKRVDTAEKRKELVTKREIYQPLRLINLAPLPADILSKPRRLRAISPLLPCLRALWEFESLHEGARKDARPSIDSSGDLGTLSILVNDKVKELQLPGGHVNSDFMRTFVQNAYAELAPTSAFIGAALSQDAINVLGGKQQPCQNLMLFNGEGGKAEVLALVPAVMKT